MTPATMLCCCFVAALLTNCTSDTPQRIVLDEKYPGATGTVAPTVFRDSIQLTAAEKQVPMRFVWTVADSANCRKIVGLRVERTGGPTDVRITEVRSVSTGCAYGDLATQSTESEHRSEFRTVLISFETHQGIKKYDYKDHPVVLNGLGQLRD